MAPEVFRHEPYNQKVDVYSYAMILFQISETSLPFAGLDPVAAARDAAMLNSRPHFPSRGPKPSGTQRMLTDLIRQCWDEDPARRPSFEDVIARLEQELATLPKHTPFTAKDRPCCSLQ